MDDLSGYQLTCVFWEDTSSGFAYLGSVAVIAFVSGYADCVTSENHVTPTNITVD